LKKIIIIAIVSVLAAIAYFILSGKSAPFSAVPETHFVAIENYAFSPAEITIKSGDRVVWENKDSTGHTVTSDGGSFDSGLFGNGLKFERTFDSAGIFPYHCIPHPQMTGTVTVIE
jgi:plastocyanin